MKKSVIHTTFKSRILTIGIAILFVLFIAYAIETIYTSPKGSDYCNYEKPYYNINNSEECLLNDGTWIDYENGQPKQIDINGNTIYGYCDLYTICNQNYQDAKDKYNRTIFFTTLILGILTFILAIFLAAESVSAGFMGGSVLLIVYGTIRYWSDLSDIWRTFMLGLALSVLVWVGYKKLR